MSCWRTYTCDVLKNVDRKVVEEALAKMDLGIDFDDKEVYGSWEDRREAVDGVLVKDGNHISMGVVLDDGTGHLKLVGDFYMTGLNSETFQDELSRAYQRINITALAELNGWTVDEATVEEHADGSCEFEIYQYA
jgi:hypothetical protein